MIAEPLLRRVLLLAGVPETDADALKELSQRLGENREIIPHILLKRSGFVGWAKTRAALEKACVAATEPAMRRPALQTSVKYDEEAMAQVASVIASSIERNLASADNEKALRSSLHKLRGGASTPDRHFHDWIPE